MKLAAKATADGRFAGEIIALSAHRLDRQTAEVVPDEGHTVHRARRGAAGGSMEGEEPLPEIDIVARIVVLFGDGGALGAGVVSAFTAAGAAVIGVDAPAATRDRQVGSARCHEVDVLDFHRGW